MLIDAIAPLAREGRLELSIVGDETEMPALRAMVEREGISSRVEFTGWLKQGDLPQHLVSHHVFGFPSVKEFGGAVVLEAMALGLVPVVADYGGPGELVASSTTGFAVPMGIRADLVSRFRKVFEHLILNPDVIRPIGQRARERVLRSFTWSTKAAQVSEVYRWVLKQREKPNFGMPFRDASPEIPESVVLFD